MKWKSIQFNKQNIEYETDKAVLIKIPHKSAYDGYKFWHPEKLVKVLEKGNGYFLSFSYTDDFIFKIFKTNKKRVKTSEYEIDGNEMAECFGQLIDDEFYLKIEEPKKIFKDVEVIKELER